MEQAAGEIGRTMLAPVPFGYCWCGCGGKTSIAKQTDRREGHTQGQPVRFIKHHHARLQPGQDLTRFWEQVDRSNPDGCQPWTGQLGQDRYGRIKVNGHEMKAHRVAWILTHGPIPLEWLVVMHTCDNPPCCNPAHLELKDRHKNNEDRDQKGRQARGERNGSAVLTEALVLGIRASHERGVRDRGIGALAKLFGVSPGTVQAIINGKTWQHVEQV
jgi:hypothetical protein